MTFLPQLAALLLVAGLLGGLLNRLGFSAILAFLLTGVVLGPHGLGWISDQSAVQELAQWGMILLFFVLGLELSFPKLKPFRHQTVWAGILQLALTTLCLSGLAYAAGIKPGIAILLGSILSLSSTTIVLKALSDQGELETVYGRLSTGVLLIQDLALIPLLAVAPTLAQFEGWETSTGALAQGLGLAALFLFFMLLVSRTIGPRLIDYLGRYAGQDVFLVFILAFALALATLSHALGLSYEVGAFIAGNALNQSLTSRQIVAHSLPFRDLFATVFFLSIGMLLDTGFLINHLGAVILMVGVLAVVKFAAATGAFLWLKMPFKASLSAGISLFQVGEFSFILILTTIPPGALPQTLQATLTTAVLLSLILTPLVLQALPLIRRRWKTPSPFQASTVPTIIDDRPLVIVAGYGPIGRNVVLHLLQAEVQLCLIEMNLQTVERLLNRGLPTIYGDISERAVLEAAGLKTASLFAITTPDPTAAELATSHARRLNPDIYILVRTRYQQAVPALKQAGANLVICEEEETSHQLAAAVLAAMGQADAYQAMRRLPAQHEHHHPL